MADKCHFLILDKSWDNLFDARKVLEELLWILFVDRNELRAIGILDNCASQLEGRGRFSPRRKKEFLRKTKHLRRCIRKGGYCRSPLEWRWFDATVTEESLEFFSNTDGSPKICVKTKYAPELAWLIKKLSRIFWSRNDLYFYRYFATLANDYIKVHGDNDRKALLLHVLDGVHPWLDTFPGGTARGPSSKSKVFRLLVRSTEGTSEEEIKRVLGLN